MIEILKKLNIKMITALALYNVGDNPFNYVIRKEFTKVNLELIERIEKKYENLNGIYAMLMHSSIL
jgi:hypothetical protein